MMLGEVSNPMATFERLGPYVIERALGSGGMGTVFLGRDERSGEPAAVKVLAPGLSAEVHFRDRFGTEIETLKKLQHPHIVQLLGYGEQDGHLFYAMEMVEGQSLQQELQAGRRFTWREVARIGVQICGALKHAHDRGVIHRDLKPANLLYTPDEQIKLADFGIAKLYGMSQLTVAGGVIGTADYMSPEQGEGAAVTNRSDLYSLGSVLFTLLAGRPPFSSRSAAEVIHKLRYEVAPPIRSLVPDTPEEFELIIAQLLEKDPAKRIATALAVSNRLKAMEFALSMETRVGGSDAFELADDGEYHLADEGKVLDSATAEAETRVVRPGEMPCAGSPEDLARHRSSTIAMSAAPAPAGRREEPQRSTGTHFTVYDEDARQRDTVAVSGEDRVPWWWKFGPWMLVAVVIAGIVWYFGRPTSAEVLLRRITDVAKDGETADLARVESSIDAFLTRFPEHPRFDEVRGLREELGLYRLQRQYERRARLRGGAALSSTVERAYLDATRLADAHPLAAATRLQALVDVYEGAALSDADQRCLQLAREQIEPLRAKAVEMAAVDLQLLEARLHEADTVAQEDPERAAAIRRGIVDLYGDQAWARAVVERARAATGAHAPADQ